MTHLLPLPFMMEPGEIRDVGCRQDQLLRGRKTQLIGVVRLFIPDSVVVTTNTLRARRASMSGNA